MRITIATVRKQLPAGAILEEDRGAGRFEVTAPPGMAWVATGTYLMVESYREDAWDWRRLALEDLLVNVLYGVEEVTS